MIDIFAENATQFDYMLLSIILGYGLSFGIKNAIVKLSGLLSGRSVDQSELGEFLDFLWLSAITYMIFSIFM